MQKQNILKFASVKCSHPSQNNNNPVMFQNPMVFSKTNQQTAKKSEPGAQKYWKNARVHTQGSETSDKKNTFKTFLDKDRPFKPSTQFKSKQNQRKMLDVSSGKIQKGSSEKVFKFVGNFVNINKNDSIRRQKMPDFFPVSSKEKRSSATNFYNNFMGNVDFKVEPSKFKDDNLLRVGSPNIHFKQHEPGNVLLSSPPQKSYLRRTIKTEADEMHTDQVRPEKLQPKFFRQSFNNLAVRRFQNDDHESNGKQQKTSTGNKMPQKNFRHTEKTEINGNNSYLKQNKQNRKTIVESDGQTFDKFAFNQVKLTAQKDQESKMKNTQNAFSFLIKSNRAQVTQKLNETVSIFRKDRPALENDRKQARVNTQQNEKSPKPYFLKQKSPQQMIMSSNQKPSPSQQVKAISWQRDLVLEQKVGEGTFGKVFKATLRTDRSKQYALKRVMIDKKYKSREVEIVLQLSHPQVMKVHGTFVTVKDNNEYLNIVMDYYDQNLYEVINSQDHEEIFKHNQNVFGTQKKFFEMRQKVFIYQLLKSLSYIHSLAICHRDIKPHNMLVRSWELVLCDFGSAKRLVAGEPNLSYICSRCYRAPELIFGSTAYTTQIDIWSVACVILQMMNDSVPVFIGENSLQHLLQVIKIVGTPSKEEVLRMNENYDVSSFDLPIIKRKQLSKLFPKADGKLVDLVERILVYDPEKRLTAVEALGHVYFDDIRNQEVFNQLSTVMPKQILETFFVFDSKELQLFRSDNAKLTKGGLRVYNQKTIDSIKQILVPDWAGFL